MNRPPLTGGTTAHAMERPPASHYLPKKYDPDGLFCTLLDEAKALDPKTFARYYHAEFEEFGRDLQYRRKPIDTEQEIDDLFGGLIHLLLNSEQEESTEDLVRAVASHCAAIDILSAYN
jgi:hypothetical protein